MSQKLLIFTIRGRKESAGEKYTYILASICFDLLVSPRFSEEAVAKRAG
jgi:hypothetical protein